MKHSKSSAMLLVAALLVASTVLATAPVFAAQPPFSATISITGDIEILVGESTTLTATWSTNRDVTRYEWSIDGVGQGITMIDGASSGSATFDFLPSAVGTYVVSFRIWHHQQSDRDASNSITITVKAAECEYQYETAFAYGGGEYAKSFLDEGFARWGWTNGPLVEGSYTFDLYAGAGQCDLDKGILVGAVTVSYSGGLLSVNFKVDAPFILAETHVYAGSEMFPLKNDVPTVAPGQYYIDSELSGSIYVIAHAVVGIPE